MFFCKADQFRAVRCDKILVCRNDVLAGFQSPFNILFCDIDRPHNLDNHLNLVITKNIVRIVRQIDACQINGTLLFEIVHDNCLDFESSACNVGNFFSMIAQDANHAAANGSETQNANFDCFHVMLPPLGLFVTILT